MAGLKPKKELTGFAKFLDQFTKICYSLYLTYMVFLFYSILPILLYRSQLDIMALIVFVVIMITMPIIITIWNSHTGDIKFKKIFKIWKFQYQMVNILAIWRYIMFFARYAIVERMMVRLLCKLTGTSFNSQLSSV